MGLINKVDMVCLSPVGYGVYKVAEAHFLVLVVELPVTPFLSISVCGFLVSVVAD